MKKYQELTANEVEQFMEEGYVILRGVVPPQVTAPIQKRIWDMIKLSPDDPSGWTKPVVHLQESISGPDVDLAFPPRLQAAMNDLMGEGRWTLDARLGWWPITFPGFHNPPWKPPTTAWHVDGSWFHHHIYSREQGLLSIHLYSDIQPGGGGTAILPGSHKYAARFMAPYEPEGKSPNDPAAKLHEYVFDRMDQVIEITGNIGDIALMHPFMAHAQSQNTGSSVRMLCNPCQSLNEHMNLHRANPADYSPVEESIIRAAGDLLEKVVVPV